jgi:hypothetical protein
MPFFFLFGLKPSINGFLFISSSPRSKAFAFVPSKPSSAHPFPAQVEAMRTAVLACADALLPGVRGQVVGSYRRGAQASGDVDFLFDHPQWRAPEGTWARQAVAAAAQASYQVARFVSCRILLLDNKKGSPEARKKKPTHVCRPFDLIAGAQGVCVGPRGEVVRRRLDGLSLEQPTARRWRRPLLRQLHGSHRPAPLLRGDRCGYGQRVCLQAPPRRHQGLPRGGNGEPSWLTF